MRHLSVDGYAMVFAEQGNGDPLLLVHGSLCDQRFWTPQMPAFAAAGLRCIAPSLRHYWPEHWDGAGDDFTIARHVADLARFVEGLAAGPVHLIGHSRGAHLAFRLAERRPELVRRLVLAEPAGVLEEALLPRGTKPVSYVSFIAEAVERVRQGAVEQGLASFFDYAVGPGSWAALPEGARQGARDNATTLLGQIREGREPFTREAAQAIRAPTLLVGGAATPPPFRLVLDGLERTIADARRVTIPGAGHLMSLEQPDAFNAAVLDFLRAA